MEKYYNEKGEVGVIISPDYGAGFSAWASNREICFDKDIIECILNNDREGVKHLMEEKYPDEYFGRHDLIVEFLKPGTIFGITCYDGAETLRVISYPGDFLLVA